MQPVIKILIYLICLIMSMNVFAQGTLEIPSGLIYTKKNPQLEFNHFKTTNKKPDKNPDYISTFPQSETTYIYADLEVNNLLYQIRDHEYKITLKFYLENGKRLGESSTTFLIQKNWQYAWYYNSWGWNKPGNWPLGTHRVEVWIDDTKFAVKKFKIVPKNSTTMTDRKQSE